MKSTARASSASCCSVHDGLVLEHLRDFGTHSVEQRALGLDPPDVDIECLGEFLFGDPALDRLDDHLVLLDRRQPIDPLVVGEGLIVIGNQARGLAVAEVRQRGVAQMAVDQHIGSGVVLAPRDDQGLDETPRSIRSYRGAF
jgi:hypothetical protein